jgi:hypothetical protein
MTDRERINQAYGLLFGAMDGCPWTDKIDNIKCLIISQNILLYILKILYIENDNELDSTTKDTP